MLVNSSGANLERATICSTQGHLKFSDRGGFQFKHVRTQEFIQSMSVTALHQWIAFDLWKFPDGIRHIEMSRDFQRVDLDIDGHKA